MGYHKSGLSRGLETAEGSGKRDSSSVRLFIRVYTDSSQVQERMQPRDYQHYWEIDIDDEALVREEKTVSTATSTRIRG